MLTTLMGTPNAEAGFRLSYLEIYNWGTFDNKVYKIAPNGQTGVLTGENGAGKTTLAHAIMTLLVKNHNRLFNQADTNETGERNEKKYFHGNIGYLRNENGQIIPNNLRSGEKHFSILLGFFSNTETKGITLAQVRYYRNSKLEIDYIFSNNALSISEHFANLDNKGEWKKKLKLSQKVDIFDSFERYYQTFLKQFGIGDKAMELFAKMFDTKALGNVNKFIREKMLEDTSAEEEFQNLYKSYGELMSIQNQIERAEKELEFLLPIKEKSQVFEEIRYSVGSKEIIRDAIPKFFASKKIEFLNIAKENKNIDISRKKEKIEKVENELKKINENLFALYGEISKNDISQQLKDLRQKIKDLNELMIRKTTNAQEYCKLAQICDFTTDLLTPADLSDDDEMIFLKTLKDAKQKKELKMEEIEKLAVSKSKKLEEISKLEDAKDKINYELNYLSQNESRIRDRLAEIRSEIAKYLGVKRENIPFAAELIKVKLSEKKWETALEKLLRNFAMSLLVAPKYYSEVTKYVNSNNLRGKLVYFRTDNIDFRSFSQPNKNSVIEKLEIKENPDFERWLETYISKNFNYTCTNNMQEFERYPKALTETGLMKNENRHEKDDSAKSLDKHNFILGWDNSETINFLIEEGKKMFEKIEILRSDIKEIEKKQKILKLDIENLDKLINTSTFDSINWKPLIKQMNENEEKYKQLLESSEPLKTLENQIREIQETVIPKKQHEKDNLIREIENLYRDLREFENQTQQCEHVISSHKTVVLEEYENLFLPYLKNYSFSLENIEKSSEEIFEKIEREIRLETSKLEKLKSEIENQMREYKNPSDEELHKKFPSWSADVFDFATFIDHRAKFIRKYDDVFENGLPQLKEKFNEKFDEDVYLQITYFRDYFEIKQQEIKNKIDELNQSLVEVDYNSSPNTFLQIKWNDKNLDNKEVTDFKKELREIISAISIEFADKTYKLSLEKIKTLINYLNEDDQRRKRIIDVKNWLTFAADEVYRADNILRRYYEDMSGMSTGEKAKLTYTIFASAILNQFNIHLKEVREKSFRFVVVDEIFKGVDRPNAEYIMQLFEKLQLQMLVVTPNEKIDVIEDFVRSVHWVKKDGNTSKVYNMTILEYQNLSKNK